MNDRRATGPLGRKTHHLGTSKGGIAVSVDLSAELADWDGVSDSLAEIRAGHEDFDRFFREVFEQFDSILTQFARERDRWQQERREIEADLGRRAAELEQQRGRGSDRAGTACEGRPAERRPCRGRRGEGSSVAREAGRDGARACVIARGASTPRGRRFRKWPRSVPNWPTRGTPWPRPGATWTSSARGSMRRGPGGAAAGPTKKPSRGSAPPKRSATPRARSGPCSKRSWSRCVAARPRLVESLEEQKRQASQQQAQWVAELRQQRALLTTLASRLTEQKLAAVQSPASPRGAARSEGDGESDPALASVMAQFEILQKDVARRRGATSDSP